MTHLGVEAGTPAHGRPWLLALGAVRARSGDSIGDHCWQIATWGGSDTTVRHRHTHALHLDDPILGSSNG